LVETSPGK